MLCAHPRDGYSFARFTVSDRDENNSTIAANLFCQQRLLHPSDTSSMFVLAMPIESLTTSPIQALMPHPSKNTLICPRCGSVHVDQAQIEPAFIEQGKFDGKRYEVEGNCEAWDCQSCGISFFTLT